MRPSSMGHSPPQILHVPCDHRWRNWIDQRDQLRWIFIRKIPTRDRHSHGHGILRRRTAHNNGYVANTIAHSQSVAAPVESSLGDFERIEAGRVGGRKGRSLVVTGDLRFLRGYFCSEINTPRNLHGFFSCSSAPRFASRRRLLQATVSKPFRIPESAASSSGR